MEDFSTALLSPVFPQFDHIAQPDLRERARLLTVTRLADAYAVIYDFVQDPQNGYTTSQAMLLHSPHEVRTVLEIE
jgi:conserved oligomeric Golgi complex subunit 6